MLNESISSSLLAWVAIKSTAVLLAAWFAVMLLRNRSAAARHLVWSAAFAALLALPFLSISLPAVRIAVDPILLPPGMALFTTDASERDTALAQTERESSVVRLAESRARFPDRRLALMLLWGAGAAAVLAQMLLAWVAVWRVQRGACRFQGANVRALAKEIGMEQQVDVLESAAGSMPMTFGLLRQAVLMPADASRWTEERRRMVLLHELAHLRRGDPATHLLSRIALSFYWWNPLAWKAWGEFLKERERAADDLVLSVGVRPSDYAGHLLEIARTMQSTRGAASAAVAMARPSQLEGRLLAILDSGRSRYTGSRTAALVTGLLAVLAIAPLAAFQPQPQAAEAIPRFQTRAANERRFQPQAPETIPDDVDATIRAATAQKDHEMLENAAKAAEALRKYDIAEKLLEASLTIRAGVSGDQSAEYGAGLLKLGQFQSRRGNMAGAEALYTKAATVLGDRPQALPALVGLGTLALGKKNDVQAVEYFEKARSINPSSAGSAMMWMAVARERQNRLEDAEAMYKGALALADPQSDDAAIILELYARFLGRQGRGDEAKPLSDRAAILRKAPQNSAAPPAPNPSVYRIGAGVMPPVLLSKVEPEYTEEARIAKYEGRVAIYVEIRTDGIPQNMRVLRGLGLGLNEKAIEAIRQWRFKPGVKDGQPVTVAATVEVNYRLM
jgi:TonB family protein